jgi:hypothetical protein
MNYDKLLKLVSVSIDEGYQYADIKFLQALRAVVELHREDHGLPGDEPLYTCDYCKLEYPCDTIKRIDKALS